MKPIHEQRWSVHGAMNGAGQVAVVADDGRMVCATRVHDGEALARAISALPDALAALMEVTPIVNGVAHSPLCGIYGLGTPKRCHDTCGRFDAALRKAGAL